jgi:hypothetical protein
MEKHPLALPRKQGLIINLSYGCGFLPMTIQIETKWSRGIPDYDANHDLLHCNKLISISCHTQREAYMYSFPFQGSASLFMTKTLFNGNQDAFSR